MFPDYRSAEPDGLLLSHDRADTMLALLMSDRKWRVRAGGPKGEFVRLVRFPMMRADGLFDEARGPNGQEVPVGSRKLETCSGSASAWLFKGGRVDGRGEDESRRRRGRGLGYSVVPSRGDAAAATEGCPKRRQNIAGCNATGWTKLQACARCRVARYCSRACQVKHWPEHKAECAAASNGA